MLPLRIRSGYDLWMRDARRANSNQVNYGAWWTLNGTHWRVSWIEGTGELYAMEVGATDRFILIGEFETKKDIQQKMRGWFDGDNLRALIQRLVSPPGAHSLESNASREED
jgi:hypothetical protein